LPSKDKTQWHTVEMKNAHSPCPYLIWFGTDSTITYYNMHMSICVCICI
jgi:hypothetical protein